MILNFHPCLSLAVPLDRSGSSQIRHCRLRHLSRLALVPEVLGVLQRSVARAATQVCTGDLPALSGGLLRLVFQLVLSPGAVLGCNFLAIDNRLALADI